jgi:hypothetical protein
MNRATIINNQGQEWRIFWVVATIILVVGLILNKSLYYIYLYFFAISIVLFFYSRFRYAEIGEHDFKLFVGFLLKLSSIQLKWDLIDFIKIKYIKKREFRTPLQGITDGLGPTPDVSDFEDVKIVEICVKKTISSEDQKKIYRTNTMMLHDRMTIKGQGKIIQLKESPEVGFDRLCKIAEIYRTGRFNLLDNNAEARGKSLLVIDIILFALPFILGIALKR